MRLDETEAGQTIFSFQARVRSVGLVSVPAAGGSEDDGGASPKASASGGNRAVRKYVYAVWRQQMVALALRAGPGQMQVLCLQRRG